MKNATGLNALAAAIVTCSVASAQNVYIDFGDPALPVPTNTYAAAAPEPGTWNGFDNVTNTWPHAMLGLVDSSGAATTVDVMGEYTVLSNGAGNFAFDHAATSGDDEALMDDLVDCGAPPATFTVTVSGLADGLYNVYSYAWAPDAATFSTTVDINGNNPQVTVGDWPGGHQLGVTYVLHQTVVAGGGDLVVNFHTLRGFGSCNGIQIVESDLTGIGTNFECPATVPNSSGNTAKIRASGSDVAADNIVKLRATGMPTHAPTAGYFLNSRFRDTAGYTVPGSEGRLCIGPAELGRYNASIFNAVGTGQASLVLDLANTPTPSGSVAILAGETWYFTVWFRDLNPTGTSNFSDAVGILFH